MSRICQITGKEWLWETMFLIPRGELREILTQLFDKRFFLTEENRWITLKVSAAGIRNINQKRP